MKDRLASEILRSLERDATFPITGYATPVDGSASAIIEFMFLDLVLSRGMTPETAAGKLKKLLPFAGDERVPEAPFESAGFRPLKPGESK